MEIVKELFLKRLRGIKFVIFLTSILFLSACGGGGGKSSNNGGSNFSTVLTSSSSSSSSSSSLNSSNSSSVTNNSISSSLDSSSSLSSKAGVLMGGTIQGNELMLKAAVSTFAGAAPGSDGTGVTYPMGVVAVGGYLYVADTDYSVIRKIELVTGAISTFAGMPSISGASDGIGLNARLAGPVGITTDGNNLYVTDEGNHTIRKAVIATGEVTTIAGGLGSSDGVGKLAGFNHPRGITNDGANLYVTDTYNNLIRKVVISTGEVTTIAGTWNRREADDGVGALARFEYPSDITIVGANLYVADAGNQLIRIINIATSSVTTLAGKADLAGNLDGIGSAARFSNPSGINTDGVNLYVADGQNHTIRKIVIETGEVTTFAGSPAQNGRVDALGVLARFYWPSRIAIGDGALYVSDYGNSAIRKIDLVTSNVSSVLTKRSVSNDGVGTGARFSKPHSLTTDGKSIFAVDSTNQTIRKINISSGAVTTLAGSVGVAGSANGVGAEANFNNPRGVTNDGQNLYVADFDNHTIRKIEISTGIVTTIAGGSGVWGSDDGVGLSARFAFPSGITTDGVNLYIADSENHTIRKMVLSTGVVSTLAGMSREAGRLDGVGASARFNFPIGITTDAKNLYVSDFRNNTIRKVEIASGNVSTLAGSDAGISGTADGVGADSRLSEPVGITTDGKNLYFVNSSTNTIRKVEISTGAVTTLAGSYGIADGVGKDAGFDIPIGVTSDGVSLYISDSRNNTIRKMD